MKNSVKQLIGGMVALLSFAIRDVFRSKTVLALVALSLGVAFASVFTSASVLAGFRQMLIDGAVGYLGHIVINPAENEDSIPRLDKIEEVLKDIPNIESYSIRSDAFATVTYEERTISPYRTVGLDKISESAAADLPSRLIEGNFISPNETQEVMLGVTLADALVGLPFDDERVQVGEEIEVTFVSGEIRKYTVAGIIDAKTFFPNWFLIFGKDHVEKLPGSIEENQIIVRIQDLSQIEKTKRDIEDRVSGVDVVTWEEESGYIRDIITTVTFIMGLISTLLTVSVFMVMSIIIFINVFQKRRQIGIIKSMGGSSQFVIAIYIVEALLYAIFSYILGFAIFWAIHQYSLQHPVSLLIGDFHTVFQISNVYISLATLVLAALGGSIVPAYIASRTQIVDVIRDNV